MTTHFPLALPELQAKRTALVAEARKLRGTDGKFADDAAREAFDSTMTEIETLDGQIKEAEAAEKTRAANPPAPSAPSAPSVEEERKRAADVEHARITGIQEATRIAGLPAEFGAQLVQERKPLDEARAAILAEMARIQTPEVNRHIDVGTDERDKFLRGAVNWLLHKGGSVDLVARAAKSKAADYDPGEFRGMTLVDLGKMTLERAGRKVRGLSKMDAIAQAFTLRAATQSTSDFAVLLENVMHKVLQAAYAVTPDSWRAWCNQSTVSDFRAHNRYRMGSIGALDALTQNGEYKHKAISDAEKGSITASTKGNIIAVTRQAIVNDDLSAFTRLLTMLGRAAALSVEADAYALLQQNAGLGPTMSDNKPVFDAAHNNLGAGSALSAAGLDADAAVMAAQTDPSGNEILDLQPAVLLVPRGLRGQSQVINDSQYDPDTVANKAQMKPNVVRGLFRDVIGSPRLTDLTRRYLFADPSLSPVFEVAFLEGQTEPVLETKDGWDTDGAEMRVRHDYGVAAVDFRGAVTNAGK